MLNFVIEFSVREQPIMLLCYEEYFSRVFKVKSGTKAEVFVLSFFGAGKFFKYILEFNRNELVVENTL